MSITGVQDKFEEDSKINCLWKEKETEKEKENQNQKLYMPINDMIFCKYLSTLE